MIKITDMGGTMRYINAELIEKMEMVPDTVIVLMNGHRYLIREASDIILDRIVEYRNRCLVLPSPAPNTNQSVSEASVLQRHWRVDETTAEPITK